VTVALAGLLVTAGCARTVTLDDPTPAAAVRSICTQLMSNLPAQVLDQKRRSVKPGTLSAAWGKPVITLRCGVPKPTALNDASQCFEVNGVGWFAEPATGGYLFTTIGRRAYIEVGVPTKYSPEANALIDVAAVVSAHDTLDKPCV
jgi:hypothetical protein